MALSRAILALLCVLFPVGISLASSLVPDEDGAARLSDYVKESFRVQSRLQIRLDGSEASSFIQRQSLLKDDLVFLDRGTWRLFKQNPIDGVSQEWLYENARLFQISSLNERILAPEDRREKLWIETVLTPLALAETWGLVDKGLSLSAFLDKVKAGPLKAGEQEIALVSPSAEHDYLLRISGVLLHDQKTKIAIEGTWHFQKTKVSAQDLTEQLARSS